MTATVYVTYPGSPGDRFDRDYWLNHHFPLVRRIWGPMGMQSVSGFFPEGDGGGVLAIAPVVFADEAAAKAAFTAPESQPIMDDIKHFTDVEAKRYLAVDFNPG